MTRLRLDVSYDGTDFSGWAVQPGRRTVAGVLLAALGTLFGAGSGAGRRSEAGADADAGPAAVTGLTVAGRTDAGVHATGQVCHVDVPAAAWPAVAGTILRGLAGLLPGDVRVRAVTEVPEDFDARFSALARRYEYRVSDAPYGVDPLRRHDTLAWPRELDVDRLNAAAARLVGEHDFAAYCRRKEHATTIRVVRRLDWRREPGTACDGGVLIATVEADAFCQSMVRSLVGALLAAGGGGRPVEWPGSLLALRERSSAVPVVPAHGLTLVAVDYPDDPGDYAGRAVATRQRRG